MSTVTAMSTAPTRATVTAVAPCVSTVATFGTLAAVSAAGATCTGSATTAAAVATTVAFMNSVAAHAQGSGGQQGHEDEVTHKRIILEQLLGQWPLVLAVGDTAGSCVRHEGRYGRHSRFGTIATTIIGAKSRKIDTCQKNGESGTTDSESVPVS